MKLRLLYPLPISHIFTKIKRAGYSRRNISQLSEIEQTYYQGGDFSLVYTPQGETMIELNNETEEQLVRSCQEVSSFFERCNLPLKAIENSSITDSRGFELSLSIITKKVALVEEL